MRRRRKFSNDHDHHEHENEKVEQVRRRKAWAFHTVSSRPFTVWPSRSCRDLRPFNESSYKQSAGSFPRRRSAIFVPPAGSGRPIGSTRAARAPGRAPCGIWFVSRSLRRCGAGVPRVACGAGRRKAHRWAKAIGKTVERGESRKQFARATCSDMSAAPLGTPRITSLPSLRHTRRVAAGKRSLTDLKGRN